MVEVSRVEIVFANTLRIMEVAEEPLPRGHSLIRITFDQFVITAEGDHVMYTLPVDHTVKMQVSYVDAKGNPATIDGDSELAEFGCEHRLGQRRSDRQHDLPRGACRQSSARCRSPRAADADLGEGVRELITTCDIEVVGGEAVAGSIQPVGEPEPVGHPDQQPVPHPEPHKR